MSFALPRSSKTLIFVRTAAFHDADDTVTEVLRPGPHQLATAPKPRKKGRRPPKARTTNEAALPSIMVAQDSWAPPPPAEFSRLQETVVRLPAPRPRAAPAAPPATRADAPAAAMDAARPKRTLSILFAAFVILLGLLGLYLVPLFNKILDTAFAALNR